MIKKGLGKGLDALISVDEDQDGNAIREIKINEIEPNSGQPRKNFDDVKLQQLSESIKQHGIIQPIIVTKEKDNYRIVAGERRWRAARLAGISHIPVIIRELTNKQLMEIALIENLQREDLNPIEEAEAFEKLIKEFQLTQEELSSIIGKSRSAIANSLRILNLSSKVKQFVISGEISSGHARAILSFENEDIQEKVVAEIIEKGLSVRDTERLVKSYLAKKENIKKINLSEEYLEIENSLKNIFGTKVKLFSNNKKGKIMIEYYSPEELDRIIELVNSIDKK